MTRITLVLALILLAQAVDNDRLRAPASTQGTQVDRHVDAHVAPREGAPAGTTSDGRSREATPPQPALGTGGLQERPLPPPVQLPRDPLYRDWR